MMSLLALLIVSCCKDSNSIELSYTLNCSEELLKYAIPQITYKDKSGSNVTFQIPDSDWETSSETMKKWEKNVYYKDVSSAEEEMSVTFIPKPGIPSDAISGVSFDFYLLLNYHVEYEGSVHDNSGAIKINSNTSINIGGNTNLEDVIKQLHDEVSISVHEGKVDCIN